MITPDEIAKPVLAEIETVTDLSIAKWFEVVYWNGQEWRSYAGSDTFDCAGYRVLRWRYADEAITK